MVHVTSILNVKYSGCEVPVSLVSFQMKVSSSDQGSKLRDRLKMPTFLKDLLTLFLQRVLLHFSELENNNNNI